MDLGNKFPVGRPVDVYVTHVQDESGAFFVQINNEEAGKLDELMEEIDLFISSGQSQALQGSDIEIGVVYLAQYSVDAKWYRARVKAVKPTGLCDVHFIDYGNTEQIPVKFVRRAQPAFLQLHQQAFQCELDGISKFQGPSFMSAISTLKELILEQELVCVTTSVNRGILLVKVFTDASCNNSILDSLLSQVQRTPLPAPISNIPAPSSSRKYSIVSLTKGEYLDFHVSHVQDPYSFSCQLLEEIPKILELLDELAEEYSDGDVPLLSSSPGYPCCAKFYEDDCWYRAVITNSSGVASGTIDVKFVDYGNSQTTSIKDVKGLKEKYLDIPMQAIECSLYGVQPEGKNPDWSSQAKELFSKLTSEKHIIAEICDQDSSGKYQVRLTDMTGDMDMQLDQILIAAKYAEKVSTNTSLKTQVSQHSNVQVSKPSPEPPKPIFPFTKEAISPGKEEKVLVSSIQSPSEFYCMLYRTSSKLEKLMADIARHYSGLSRDDEWLSSPSVGDPCCARFSDDQSWYRAIVKDVQSSGKVKVQFIDYGNYDTVIPKDVKRLAPQFSELPYQAIGCTMHRICPNGQDWRHMDTKKFEELALEYTGKLTIISENSDGMKNVELLISLKGKEVNVAEAMLLSGNARLVEGACSLSENLASISSKKFPKLNLPLGTYEDIFVTHVDDPANFWCQLVKHKDELDAVMNAVEEHCTLLNTPLRAPSLGLACCAQFSDDAWYRANISGVMKNHQVEVHFIDYGNYDTIPLSKLRTVKPELMNLPAQAFKCRLEQMDTKNSAPFSHDVIDKFIDLTVDKELVGMIASYDESAQQYLISCTDTSGGNTLDVYEQIASSLPQSSVKECIIPKQDLKPGQREHVCITTVTGLSKFYCQLMRSASQFDAMMNNLDEHYNKLTTTQEDMSGLQPGNYCAAKYSEDNSWYRAKIIDSKINVLYVDFGNGEQLSAKSIKRLVPMFAQLPEQVLLCTLAGDTSGFSDSQFIDLTLDKEFDMEIMSFDNNGTAKVNLYTKAEKKPIIQLLTKEKPKPMVNIQPNSLAAGAKETAYATFAVDISKFYVQLSKSGDSLAELMNEIHEYYSKLAETQDGLDSPQVGMFCVANFSEDNGWYRAKVVAVHSDSIEVLYIDYGNSEVIPLSRAKVLKPEFASLPSQALHCKLSGVASISDDESAGKFLKLVEDPEMPFELQVVAVQPSGVHEVMLVNKETGTSVNQELSGKSVVSDISKVTSVSPASLNPIPLTIGETYDGQSGVASSPSQFWFSLNKYVDDLNALLDEMAEYYSSLGPADGVLSSASVGSYCCCQYSVDLGWYRAKIMSLTGSQAEVCFVDFGNSEKVALNELKVLKDNFQSLPIQAISCSLNKVTPTDSVWSEDAKTAFSDLIVEKDAVIKVIKKSSDNCYVVDLLDVNGQHFAADMLNSKGFAASSMQQGSIQDFKPFVKNFNSGDYIDVNPIYCVTPHDFHCQVLTQDNIVAFNQMTNQLQDVYSYMGPSENTIGTPSKGMPCCILYPADNTWNRGRIAQVNNDNTLKVTFVDYGNEETVLLNQVKVLQPEFLDLPVQSIHCSLHSVKPCTNNQWSDVAVKRFLELVDQKHLVGEVIDAGDKLSIELYDTKDDSLDVSIAQVLISENHAVSTSQQTKISHPKISKLSQLVPSNGDTVYITAVDSPENIYCQLSGTEDRIDNLMANLKEFYESGQQEALQSISPNELCVALFSEDGVWYRAVAEEVSPEGITVRFIDYGNSETLSLGSIRAIDNQFLSEQILAIDCALSGVLPVNDDIEWSPEAADFLATAGGDDGFTLNIKSAKDTLEVGLSDSGGDLSQRLVNEGLAKSTIASSVSNIAQAPPQPSIAGNYKATPVTIGTVMEVYITDVTSPGQFYCQLADYGDSLDEMMNSISNHYSNMDQSQACVSSPEVGQPCIAIFEEDSMWYRAKVESVSQLHTTIRFVDYGNTQNVKVSDLKQIEAQFLKLPALAALCTVDPKKATWTADETENFKAVTGEEKVSAEVIGKEGDRYVVRISQGGSCVTDSFLKTSAHLDIPCQVIQPNQTENVYVAFAKSSSEICVQLASYSDQLDQVMATIELEIKSQPTLKEDQVVPGMLCCAYFEDGWYRAVITSQPNQGQVMVEYVDYGNTASLAASELRAVPQSCVALPRQALHCILEGQGLENVSKDTLENTLMESRLTATFLRTDGQHWTVNLKQDGVDVTDILLINTEVVIKDPNFTYPEIVAGSTAQVFVSHIENPGEFHIQFKSSTDKLDVLGSKLNEAYGQPGLTCNVEVGRVCCAQFSEDGCWYRGTVTSLQDDSHVQVHFVDYGNSDVVDKGKVMVLKEEFLELPILAIQCSLDSPGTQWSDGELSKFEALVLDQELTVQFLARQDNQWHVKLTCLETSILELMRRVEETNVDVILETLTIPKKEVSEGLVVECVLTHAELTGLFHLQFLSDPFLEHVTDIISDHYPSLWAKESCLNDCQVGSFCCVKFSEDEQWYRAVVTGLCSNFDAIVKFIDYGNSEVADIPSFKTLLDELYEIPQCSIPCKLAGRKSELSPDEIEALQAQMLDKTLSVTFVRPNDQGWDVVIEVEGKFLNEFEAVTDDNKDEAKQLSVATLLRDTRQGVKFLMADNESTVWIQPVITENELNTLMNSIAENPPDQPMPMSEISTGKLCLCRFTEDNEWYRAKVIDCNHDQVTVNYVDFGNTETVGAVRVSPISESYLQLPAQAIKCSLYGVEPLREDILNKLNEEYFEVQLEAEVVETKENVDSVRLFKEDKELILNLVEMMSVCKEPVPAASQLPLNEPIEDATTENEVEKQQEGDNGSALEEIAISDQPIDSNENSSLAVDSKKENMVAIGAETSTSLHPLDQDDSESEFEKKNEVITELSKEELAYYSQECDVGENTRIETTHVSLPVTTEKDLDHHEDISCENNQQNGLIDEKKVESSTEIVTSAADLDSIVKDGIEGESINGDLSIPTKTESSLDAAVQEQTEFMALSNDDKQVVTQTAQDKVKDENRDAYVGDLQSECTEPILSKDADDKIMEIPENSAQEIESEEKEKEVQPLQVCEETVPGTDALEKNETMEANEQSLQVQKQDASENLQVQIKENEDMMSETNEENKILKDDDTSERVQSINSNEDLQTQATEVEDDEAMLESNSELKSSEAYDTSQSAERLDSHEDNQTEAAEENIDGADAAESKTENKTSEADDTSQQTQSLDSNEENQTQAAEENKDGADATESKTENITSEGDDTSQQAQSLDSHEDNQTQAAEENIDGADVTESKTENITSEADDTSQQVQSLDPQEENQTQAAGQNEDEANVLDSKAENKTVETYDTSQHVQSLDSHEESQTQATEENEDRADVVESKTQACDTSQQVQSVDLHEERQASEQKEETKIIDENKKTPDVDETVNQVQGMVSHEDQQTQANEQEEDRSDISENNCNNETLSVNTPQSLYSTDEKATEEKEEVTDMLEEVKDEKFVTSEQITQEEDTSANKHLPETEEKEGDKVQSKDEDIEAAVSESSIEHDTQKDDEGKAKGTTSAAIESKEDDSLPMELGSSEQESEQEEVKASNGHITNGKTNPCDIDSATDDSDAHNDGCLSDSALEKLDNLLEGPEAEEFSQGAEGRMKNKKSCQPM